MFNATVCTSLLVIVTVFAASAAEDLPNRLKSARPGQTISLPAGEFHGGVTLPAGVSLKGAGYGKTIIDASGAENGLRVSGKDAVISDLTVRGATGANVFIDGATNVTLRRVRSMGGLMGVNLSNSKGCRVENVVADGNRYGIVLTGGEGNVVVNCTMAGNASLGLSLSSGKTLTAFNNLLTDSATAVLIGDQVTGVTLDHNLYLGFSIGKFHAQPPRSTLNGWQFMSGQDAHSVSIPVTYQDVTNGLYKATNVLDWAQDRPVTAEWGATKLAGHEAPADDIDGVKRPAAPGLGAYEVTAKAARPAAGSFTVSARDDFVSAGVFDKNGKLVTYLFQALPLAKGKYSFWLPSRSWREKPIAAGDYEVRVLESKLDWKYLGFIANTGDPNSAAAAAPAHPDALAIDDGGRVLVARDINEGHINLRGYDGTGKYLWLFHGTSNKMNGLATAADGLLYALRIEGTAMRLSRVHPATGEIAAWGQDDYGSVVLKGPAIYTGIAALGKQLFYTDTSNNVLRVGTTDSPEPTQSITVKTPTSPSGDAKAGVVWVISEGTQLVAVSPDGKVVGQSPAVARPVALAARDGRLAVASAATGKIHLFDCSNPAALKEVGALGRGDGPDGPVLSDRFWFQNDAMPVVIAIGSQQQMAVGEEEGRVQVFDKSGKLMWSSFSTEGGSGSPSRLDPGRIYGGQFIYETDSEKGTWQLAAFHRDLKQGGRILGDIRVGDQTFVTFLDVQNDEHQPGVRWGRMVFVKVTSTKAIPVGGLVWKWATAEPWTYRYDDNGDGQIDYKDKVAYTLTDAQGKPASLPMNDPRWTAIQPNGELAIAAVPGAWMMLWPCAGLDAQGAPKYQFADQKLLKGDADAIVSPYDHRPSGPGAGDHIARANDEWVCLARASGAPWKVMINNGGADIVGLDKNGGLNWFHPFAQINPIGSLKGSDGVYVGAMADSYDCFVVNDDGLAMNGLCPAEKAEYVGNWVDDPTGLATFVDKQGKLNVLMVDYVIRCCSEWYRLEKKEARPTKFPFTVTAETATTLAALPFQPLDVTAGQPATPMVHIPQLKAPLKIDGELQKWRDAGITPQLIITPETSAGIKGGPRDCSAVIRLAYLGQDLYLQVFRFDDVITQHQPTYRAYLQDTVEMAVNGIWEGIKHNLSMTTDAGPVNQVDGWKLNGHVLDRNDSPIVIKVLENAETVSERKLIESIYGVDMSKCKVQIFETRIPMNDKTYAGRLPAKLDLKPGLKFWLGFMIDDNDTPGTDLQNLIYWPVTYGTTTPKEQHGLAILD